VENSAQRIRNTERRWKPFDNLKKLHR
jgi:hypothetical protein